MITLNTLLAVGYIVPTFISLGIVCFLLRDEKKLEKETGIDFRDLLIWAIFPAGNIVFIVRFLFGIYPPLHKKEH